MQRQNVRVLQLGGDLDLVEKSIGADHRREFGTKDFDGHVAVVLDVPGEIDRGHATGAEFTLDGVAVRPPSPVIRCSSFASNL